MVETGGESGNSAAARDPLTESGFKFEEVDLKASMTFSDACSEWNRICPSLEMNIFPDKAKRIGHQETRSHFAQAFLRWIADISRNNAENEIVGSFCAPKIHAIFCKGSNKKG